MLIGIDLDSTLNTLDKSWAAWIQENHDPEFTLDKWTSWHIHTLTPAGEKVYEFIDEADVFANLDVEPGAIEATQALLHAGHDLVVISALYRNGNVMKDKADWVMRNFPHIGGVTNIFFATRKDLITVDVLIDDGPHNILKTKARGVVFDKPWNRHEELSKFNRIYGWEDHDALLTAIHK